MIIMMMMMMTMMTTTMMIMMMMLMLMLNDVDGISTYRRDHFSINDLEDESERKFRGRKRTHS